MIIAVHHLSHWLEGKSSPFLTVTLIVLAVLIVLIALFGNNLLKAIMVAYIVLP